MRFIGEEITNKWLIDGTNKWQNEETSPRDWSDLVMNKFIKWSY